MTIKRNLLASTISGLLALSALPAFAQDAPPASSTDQPEKKKEEPKEITKITVTGSRIPVAQQETSSPTVTITAEEIETQGYKNVSDVLRAQPLSTGATQ